MTGNLFICPFYCKIKYAAASSDARNLYRHSFNEAVEYRSLITKVRASEDVPVILVANKVDLEQTMRSVQTAEGEALAEKFACPFYETSAAHRRHVDDVFHTLVREIRCVIFMIMIIIFIIITIIIFIIIITTTTTRKTNKIFFRKRNDEGEFKENETSRWRKVWNNIFKKIKRGRKKV